MGCEGWTKLDLIELDTASVTLRNSGTPAEGLLTALKNTRPEFMLGAKTHSPAAAPERPQKAPSAIHVKQIDLTFALPWCRHR